MGWVDEAIEDLERDYEEGVITLKELQECLRDIQGEIEAEAEEAAGAVIHNYYGGW